MMSAILEIFNFQFSKRELIELEQEKVGRHTGIGFALLVLARLSTFGWSITTAMATGTAPQVRMAFAPASLSEINISSM